MSNALTTTHLPAHLQALLGNNALASLNKAASQGISVGGWPRISIKGGRFRLQDPQGPEVVVPINALDVIVVAANTHGLSKVWYAGAYDPAGEDKAPDCYSDNGVAPSARSAKPQCGTCAACPHNAWGSKITPAGTQIKACSDTKKLAVLLADNPTGPVFELRIPGASLGNWGAYVRGLEAAGIPTASIVTRIVFDVNAEYPKLIFGPLPVAEGQTPYITAEMAQNVIEVANSAEARLCTGEDDQPFQGQLPTQPTGTSGHLQGQALPSVSGPPLPVNHPRQSPPPNPMFPHAGQPPTVPYAPPPAPIAPAVAPAPAKRTRTKKAAEPAPVAPPVGAAPATGVAPGYPGGHPPAVAGEPPSFLRQNRDVQTPLNPPSTDAALDDILRKAMQA